MFPRWPSKNKFDLTKNMAATGVPYCVKTNLKILIWHKWSQEDLLQKNLNEFDLFLFDLIINVPLTIFQLNQY